MTLPEMDSENGSFQSTKRDDGSWEVVHFDTQKKYRVKQTDKDEPPKDDEDDEWGGWSNAYLNWADGDPDK